MGALFVGYWSYIDSGMDDSQARKMLRNWKQFNLGLRDFAGLFLMMAMSIWRGG